MSLLTTDRARQALFLQEHGFTQRETVQLQTMESPDQAGCSAILWLRTNTGNTSNHQLIHHLRNMHGIRSVRQMSNKPLMMMVRYCPDDLNLKRTLDHFGQEGALLRRVGC